MGFRVILGGTSMGIKSKSKRLKRCTAKDKGWAIKTIWGWMCPHGQNEKVMENPTDICEGCEFLEDI